MTNTLRMPLCEWLYRMHEAGVPYQARGLATYAVLFKVTANDELAKLCGMDMKGRADKTYNKWKKKLSDSGCVIVKVVTIGRSKTIDVSPAINGTLVTFTDVIPRDARKFYDHEAVKDTRKSYGEKVEVTSKSYAPTVEVTAEQPSSVEVTDASRAPIRAHIESPSEILNKPSSSRGECEGGTDTKPPLLPTFGFLSEDVTFDKHGNVVLVNGLKSKWLEFFSGDKIAFEAALMAVNIERSSRSPVEKQVANQLKYPAQRAREAAARDRSFNKPRKTGSGMNDNLDAITEGFARAREEDARAREKS